MATVGIDLGTTNSLVSVWQDDKCTLIPNNLGEYLTPSVVGIDENGEMLVGRTAKERLISHPENTVASFKRFMGTEKTFMLGNRRFTAADLSSMVLGGGVIHAKGDVVGDGIQKRKFSCGT